MSDPYARLRRAENKRIDRMWRSLKEEPTSIIAIGGDVPLSLLPLGGKATESTTSQPNEVTEKRD